MPNFSPLSAQECETPGGTLYPYPYEDPLVDPTEVGESIFINIYLHAVRDDEGSGGVSDAELEILKSSLSAPFAERNIFFNYCAVEFNCEDCYDGWSDLSTYFATQSLDDGLNLYVFPVTASVSPRAEAIPSKNAAVEYVGAHTSYAHEIGHCLGLLHTFEYSDCPSGLPEEFAWFFVGPTLTHGVNCHALGDQICDTPPDLRLCVTSTTCSAFENPESLADAFSHVYIDPDNVVKQNIMSYYVTCRNQFTEGQETKIREILDLAEELDGVISPFSHIERVTGNETWSDPLQFNHDVILESMADLTIETTISFTPGHGIIMEEGSLLFLAGATLTVSSELTSCPSTTGELWKGIGVQRQETGPYCIVQTENGSIIEHAEKAIYGIGKGRQWTLVYSTDFKNNKISFESIGLTGGATFFQTSDFIIDENYKLNSYFPQIHLINCSPMSVNGCNFDFQLDESYTLTRQAIQSYNSHVIVRKWGSTRSEFNNWTVGVYARGNLGSRLMFVRDADFTGYYKGIESQAFWRTTSVNNMFDMSNENIASTAYGIFSEESRLVMFNDNDFLSTDSDIQTTGILVSHTGVERLMVGENSFVNLDIGIQGISISGPSGNGGIMFLCNENDGNRDYDFDIHNAVNPMQGLPTRPAGNTFSHTDGTKFSDFRLTDVPYYVRYYYKTGVAEENPEDYSPNLTPSGMPGSTGCSATPFVIDPAEADSIGEYEYVKSSFEGVLNDLIEDRDDLLDGGNTAAMVSLIHSTSGSNPSYVASQASGVGPWLSLDAAAAFMDNIGSFSEAQIVSVLSASPFVLSDVEIYDFVFSTSSPLSSGSQSTIAAAVASGDARSDAEAGIEMKKVQLDVNTNAATSYVLLQDSLDYELLREVLGWREDFQAEIAIAESFMDQGEYEDALDYLDGVAGRISLSSEEEDDLENFVLLTNLLVNVYEDDRYEAELTSLEIDTLEDIAGNGLEFSRQKACALLSYFYAYECSASSPLVVFEYPDIPETDISNISVIVSPNPARDEITLDLTNVSVSSTSVQLYHMDGRMIRELKIPPLADRIDMSLADLQNGIYLIRVIDADMEIYSGKIIKH